jgi:hypothetical protein
MRLLDRTPPPAHRERWWEKVARFIGYVASLFS